MEEDFERISDVNLLKHYRRQLLLLVEGGVASSVLTTFDRRRLIRLGFLTRSKLAWGRPFTLTEKALKILGEM